MGKVLKSPLGIADLTTDCNGSKRKGVGIAIVGPSITFGNSEVEVLIKITSQLVEQQLDK